MHDRAREVGLREIYTPVDEDAKRDLAGELVQAEAVLQTLPPMERGRAMQIALRRLAFQAIYQFDASPAASAADIEVFLERVPGMSAKEIDRAGELIAGAWGARAEADKELGELSPDWPVASPRGCGPRDHAPGALRDHRGRGASADRGERGGRAGQGVQHGKVAGVHQRDPRSRAQARAGRQGRAGPPEGTGVLEPGRGS